MELAVVEIWTCGKVVVGSEKVIHMVGFNGIVDSFWEEDVKMMIDKSKEDWY